MKHAYINFRAPADLIARLDAMAEAESKRTGLPVGRSAMIRRAVEQDLTRREQEHRRKEGGDGK
jgi:predicted transcriptional regulator